MFWCLTGGSVRTAGGWWTPKNRDSRHRDTLVHQWRQQECCRSLGKVPHALQVVLIPHSFCSARLVLMATAKLTFQSKLQMQFHFCQESRPRVTAYSDADQRLHPMSKLTSTPSVKENNCWFAADWGSVASSRESLYAVWCVYQRAVKSAAEKWLKAFLCVLLRVFDKLNCTFYDLWCHSSPHERPNRSKLSLRHQNQHVLVYFSAY